MANSGVMRLVASTLEEARTTRRPRRSSPPGACSVLPAMERAVAVLEAAHAAMVYDPDPEVVLNLLDAVPTWMRRGQWYEARRAVLLLVTNPDVESSRETVRPSPLAP